MLQASYRGYVVRRDAKRTAAAVRIQKCARGNKGRRVFKERREIEAKAEAALDSLSDNLPSSSLEFRVNEEKKSSRKHRGKEKKKHSSFEEKYESLSQEAIFRKAGVMPGAMPPAWSPDDMNNERIHAYFNQGPSAPVLNELEISESMGILGDHDESRDKESASAANEDAASASAPRANRAQAARIVEPLEAKQMVEYEQNEEMLVQQWTSPVQKYGWEQAKSERRILRASGETGKRSIEAGQRAAIRPSETVKRVAIPQRAVVRRVETPNQKRRRKNPRGETEAP